MTFIHRFVVPGVLLMCCASCDHAGPPAPSPSPVAGTAAKPGVTASYAVTLDASSSCSDRLPADARERQYVARLLDSGQIQWLGPTLQPPEGHAIMSTGQLSGNSFALTIGTKEDPQSDAFHGLWDVIGGSGGLLTIAGTGTGTVAGGRVTGVFAGDFDYYQGSQGTYCTAADHSFTMIAQ